MAIRPQDLKGMQLRYRAGMPYHVEGGYWVYLNLFLPFPGFDYWGITKFNTDSDGVRWVGDDLVRLYDDSRLFLGHLFPFDACSGPTLDDESNMRAGAHHDGGAYLSRHGYIPPETQDYFDKILKNTMNADGNNPLRSEYYHFAVDRFGDFAFKLGYDPYPVQLAPRLIEYKENNGFSFNVTDGLKPAG